MNAKYDLFVRCMAINYRNLAVILQSIQDLDLSEDINFRDFDNMKALPFDEKHSFYSQLSTEVEKGENNTDKSVCFSDVVAVKNFIDDEENESHIKILEFLQILSTHNLISSIFGFLGVNEAIDIFGSKEQMIEDCSYRAYDILRYSFSAVFINEESDGISVEIGSLQKLLNELNKGLGDTLILKELGCFVANITKPYDLKDNVVNSTLDVVDALNEVNKFILSLNPEYENSVSFYI